MIVWLKDRQVKEANIVQLIKKNMMRIGKRLSAIKRKTIKGRKRNVRSENC